MSRLQLSIQKSLDGESTVAIGELLDAGARTVKTLQIPVGVQVEPLTVSVDPGSYVVRAVLPSGQRLTQQVHVESSAAPTVAVLDADDAAPDPLGWHHFATGEGDAAFWRGSARRPDPSPLEGRFEGVRGKFRDRMPQLLLTPQRAQLTLFSRGPEGPSVEHLLEDGPSWYFEFRAMDCSVKTLSSGPFSLVRFDAHGEYRPFTPRLFLRVRLGARTQIAVLPIPWRSQVPMTAHGVEQSRYCPVEVMLSRPPTQSPRRRSADAPSVIVSTIVRDRNFGAILPFMAAGEAPYARTILDANEGAQDVRLLSQRMLFEKQANPLAAAAGGYILARTADRVPPEWLEWTYNLMQWFPWLPDGAILHGALLLQTQSDVETARECFLRAVQRGVPSFTEGLRMLSEGLTRVMRLMPGDVEIEQLLVAVRRYAIAADPRQAFTTFYGEDPENPRPPQRPLRRLF